MGTSRPRLTPMLVLILIYSLLPLRTHTTAYKTNIHSNSPKRCEPITIPLCQGIGYNMTSYPNSYGHERQEEAGLEVHQFYPLVEVNCYKHLKFFLCSMYTPICQNNYDEEVMPCREVCLEARKRCAPLMHQYGFKWPQTLRCDPLPRVMDQESSGRLCAAPPDTQGSGENGKQEDVGIGLDLTRNDEVVVDVVDTNPQCECKCVLPFYVAKNPGSRVQNVSNCAYACRSEAIQSSEDRHFLDTWISVWSSICLALSVFTVMTFLTDMGRFPYPERPIFFLSLCQMMVSLGFIIRVLYGHQAIACDGGGTLLKSAKSMISHQFAKGGDFSLASSPSVTSQSESNGLCLMVFVLIYFFGMAASAWWVVLSLSWVLAAVPHWSTEWIAKYSTYFHLFAWLLPAFQTILVLMFNAVDGDPTSGICYVGNTDISNLRAFVLGPLLVYFLVGVCFLSIGFLNLWGIRSNLKKTHPGVDKTSKLTQLMSKIGIYSVLYTLPAIFVILVLFYEQQYRPVWEQARLCPCAQQLEGNGRTMLLLSLIKAASMLVVGWTSGVWIISAKTLQSWRRAFCWCFCCCADEEVVHRRQGYYPAASSRHQGDMVIHRHNAQAVHYDNTDTSLGRQYHRLIGPNGESLTLSNNNNNYGELMYTKRHQADSLSSPMTYATNGTLRHCQALHGAILPENV